MISPESWSRSHCGPHGERIPHAHDLRFMDKYHGRDEKTDDKRVEPSRARLDVAELSQAVTFTSNQLRSAAGIGSIQVISNSFQHLDTEVLECTASR